jgi:hypothetical protein
MKVWVQKWEETETGWGCRPDGYTLHTNRADIDLYLKVIRDAEAELGYNRSNPPPEYSRPSGEPYQTEITDKRLLGKLAVSKHGCAGPQKSSGDYPAPVTPGADRTGWVTVDEVKSKQACLHSAQDWYIVKATGERGCSECDNDRTRSQLAEMIALGERAKGALLQMEPKPACTVCGAPAKDNPMCGECSIQARSQGRL